MIFRKEPFFYGHDNYDQLVKIAKVQRLLLSCSCTPQLGSLSCYLVLRTAGLAWLSTHPAPLMLVSAVLLSCVTVRSRCHIQAWPDQAPAWCDM